MVWREIGAHERGTYLVRAIVYIFVYEMDTERKQIFTTTLEDSMEKLTASLYIPSGMAGKSMALWDAQGLGTWPQINLP